MSDEVTLEPMSRLICMTAGKAQNDQFADHWRTLCAERGHPVPKRRPGTFRFKATPNVYVDDDELTEL